MIKKQCIGCKTEKEISFFEKASSNPKKNSKDGFSGRCKQCRKQQRDVIEAPRRAQRKKDVWLAKYPWIEVSTTDDGKSIQLDAINRKKLEKHHHLKSKFDLTLTQFNTMLEQQRSVCAICHQSNLSDINLAVDHDHSTGRIRGLLCSRCNIALGNFKDNPELITAAIQYLLRSPQSQG